MSRIESPLLWYVKIPDGGSRGASKMKSRVDVVGSFNGQAFVAEWKLVKGGQSFRLDYLRDEQIDNLINAYARKVVAYVIIGHLITLKNKVPTSVLYVVPIQAWLKIMATLAPDAKSVHLEQFFIDYQVLPIIGKFRKTSWPADQIFKEMT